MGCVAISGLRQKNPKGDPLVTLSETLLLVKSLPETLHQNSLYPVCVKYDMECVIVEGDFLALFAAQM